MILPISRHGNGQEMEGGRRCRGEKVEEVARGAVGGGGWDVAARACACVCVCVIAA